MAKSISVDKTLVKVILHPRPSIEDPFGSSRDILYITTKTGIHVLQYNTELFIPQNILDSMPKASYTIVQQTESRGNVVPWLN